MLIPNPAQAQPKGDSALDLEFTSNAGSDFLNREKALLGDDADLFASGNDSAAFVDGGADDLLGGGQAGGEEVTEFESSFPEINTQNDVRITRCDWRE